MPCQTSDTEAAREAPCFCFQGKNVHSSEAGIAAVTHPRPVTRGAAPTFTKPSPVSTFWGFAEAKEGPKLSRTHLPNTQNTAFISLTAAQGMESVCHSPCLFPEDCGTRPPAAQPWASREIPRSLPEPITITVTKLLPPRSCSSSVSDRDV